MTSTATDNPTMVGPRFDLDAAWQVHPRVAVRPEPFGALLYHYDTRKLSFLKSTRLRELLEALPAHPTARAACRAIGIDLTDPATARQYVHALTGLAASNMLIRRTL